MAKRTLPQQTALQPTAAQLFAFKREGALSGCIYRHGLFATLLVLCLSFVDSVHAGLHASIRQSDYSARVGEPIMVVAEMVATEAHNGCRAELVTKAPIKVGFHFSDGQGGPRIGEANAPIDLKARVPQAMFLIIAPQALLEKSNLEFNFNCADGAQAPSVVGTNTLNLTVNVPNLPVELRNTLSGAHRYGSKTQRPQDCAAWPAEHIFLFSENTLLVTFTGASLSKVESLSDLSSTTLSFDYKVEEVIRGSQQRVGGIEGPVTNGAFGLSSIPPLGKRFLISTKGGAVRWDLCSGYWMVPIQEPGECQLYRFRRLAKKSHPFNERCEAANIKSYLWRLTGSSTALNQTNDYAELKRLWQKESGHSWDGREVHNDVLYRFRKNEQSR